MTSMMSRTTWIAGFGCFVIVLLSAAVASAQTAGFGAIVGSITDSTGAVLPGVTATLSGSAQAGTPTTVTDTVGLYRFAAVLPGEYSVKFELSGFTAVIREHIRSRSDSQATVNMQLTLSSVRETVVVSGASPVVDLQSTRVTTSMTATQLASMPLGSRDVWAVLGQMPAVAMDRVDVGGTNSGLRQGTAAYGLTSGSGNSRGLVEGIVTNVGSGEVGSYMGAWLDIGTAYEMSVSAVGNSAEMPSAGILTQVMTKSGGNAYHGSFYADYQNDSLEAHNIDDTLIARGLTGSAKVPARELDSNGRVLRCQRRCRGKWRRIACGGTAPFGAPGMKRDSRRSSI